MGAGAFMKMHGGGVTAGRCMGRGLQEDARGGDCRKMAAAGLAVLISCFHNDRKQN